MSKDKIIIQLPEQPFSYRDRKCGVPDALKGSEGYVGRDSSRTLTLFQRMPGYSKGFYPSGGYSLPLPKDQSAIFAELHEAEIVKVVVTW
jgi:hypothetical protein